jgi:hypothetical protein
MSLAKNTPPKLTFARKITRGDFYILQQEIDDILRETTSTSLLSPSSSAMPKYFPQSNWSKVFLYEENYVIQQIKTVLWNATDEDGCEQLRLILVNHWDIIKGSNLSYHCNTETKANRVCIAVASFLEKVTQNNNRYLLLMPTITNAEDPISHLSLRQSSFTLPSIILSDDHTRIIDVASRFKSREKDGDFSGKSFVSSSSTKLSESEEHRLIHHSGESFKYCAMQTEWAKRKKQETTLYFLLSIFSEKLRPSTASDHGGGCGTQDRAGEEAYVFIVTFAEILEKLPENQKKLLYGLSKVIPEERRDHKVDTLLTFKQIWEERIAVMQVDDNDVTYCVGSVCEDLEKILLFNQDELCKAVLKGDDLLKTVDSLVGNSNPCHGERTALDTLIRNGRIWCDGTNFGYPKESEQLLVRNIVKLVPGAKDSFADVVSGLKAKSNFFTDGLKNTVLAPLVAEVMGTSTSSSNQPQTVVVNSASSATLSSTSTR